jgi:glycosyl transferase family 87
MGQPTASTSALERGRLPELGGTLGRLWVRWRSPIRLALSVIGGIVIVLLLANPDAHGIDARGYWAFDPANPYASAVGNLNAQTAFRYGPPIALAFIPFQALSWTAFITVWTLILVAALMFMGRSWALACAALYPVAMELSAGNVNLLIALAAVVGLRWPVTWSFLLLTKVTPGVGLVWFAARKEWRNLAIAIAATAAISLFSWLIAPQMWGQWFDALRSMVGIEPEGHHLPIPLPIRVIAMAILVAWGARTDRPWTVVVAVTLAMPTVFPASLSALVGLLAVRRFAALPTERTPAT